MISTISYEYVYLQNVNECLSSPCQHGGVCTDEVAGFSCQCPDAFTGPTCDEDVNECITTQPCRNYVACRNTYGSYECECLPGEGCVLPLI